MPMDGMWQGPTTASQPSPWGLHLPAEGSPTVPCGTFTGMSACQAGAHGEPACHLAWPEEETQSPQSSEQGLLLGLGEGCPPKLQRVTYTHEGSGQREGCRGLQGEPSPALSHAGHVGALQMLLKTWAQTLPSPYL